MEAGRVPTGPYTTFIYICTCLVYAILGFDYCADESCILEVDDDEVDETGVDIIQALDILTTPTSIPTGTLPGEYTEGGGALFTLLTCTLPAVNRCSGGRNRYTDIFPKVSNPIGLFPKGIISHIYYIPEKPTLPPAIV